MAAGYLFHLVKNDTSVDGNKRVSAPAALVFSALNRFECQPPQDDFAEMVPAVAGPQGQGPSVRVHPHPIKAGLSLRFVHLKGLSKG